MFDEINVHAQCKKCNRFLYGNGAEYSARIIKKYGLEEYEKLMHRSRQVMAFTQEYLQGIIDRYSLDNS